MLEISRRPHLKSLLIGICVLAALGGVSVVRASQNINLDPLGSVSGNEVPSLVENGPSVLLLINDLYCSIVPKLSILASSDCGINIPPVSLNLRSLSNTAFSLPGSSPRVLTVAGLGIVPVDEKNFVALVTAVFAPKKISLEKWNGFLSSFSLTTPQLVDTTSEYFKKYSTFALGASVARADTSFGLPAVKKDVPFIDRVSLALFCSLSGLSVQLDQTHCDYSQVASGAQSATLTELIPSTSATSTEVVSNTVASSALDTLAANLSSQKAAAPVYLTQYITSYVPVSGPRGEDGKNGRDGVDGKDAKDSQGGFGGYITPTTVNQSSTPYFAQSLLGVSTIGYLRDVTLDNALLNNGSSTNMYLANARLYNGAFTGYSIFSDTANFTGTAEINNLTATSSNFVNASSTNGYTNYFTSTNATSTNLYSSFFSASTSTLADTFLTNATTTNAFITSLFATTATTTTFAATNASTTNFVALNATTTNSTSTNAFIQNLTVGSSTTGSMTVNGTLFVTGTSTLATTTVTALSSTEAVNASSTLAVTGQSTFYNTLNVLADILPTTDISRSFGTNALRFLNLFAQNIFATSSVVTNATSTNFFTQNLAVGNASTTGNQTIDGSLSVSGTSTLGANVYLNGNVVVGTSSNEMFTVNALVNSDITPAQNKVYDLGSASFYWRNLYADNINVNSISAASTTISGTSNNDFTLNSDNASTDTENMSLVFFRGLVTPNALIRWNATTKRLEANQSFKVQNETPSVGTTTLTVQGGAGQGTTNLFELINNAAAKLSVFNAQGWLGIGSTTPGSALTVIGNGYFGGSVTATGTLGVSGVSTLATTTVTQFTASGNTSLQNASSTALTVSGNTTVTGTTTLATTTLATLSSSGAVNASSTFAVTGQSTFYGTANHVADILPTTDIARSIGSNALRFLNLFAQNIFATSSVITNATSTNLFTTSLSAITGLFTTLSSTGTSTFATAGGSVGIGTSTPTAFLDVQGATSTIGTGLGINLIAQNALGGTNNLGGSVNIFAGNSSTGGSSSIGGNIAITAGTGAGAGTAAARGGAISITGGTGGSGGRGGAVAIAGGAAGASGGFGGTLSLAGGASTVGSGGALTLFAGQSGEGAGGAVSISSGPGISTLGTGNFSGGGLTLASGAGVGTGSGGDVSINSGAGGSSGTAGNISLSSTGYIDFTTGSSLRGRFTSSGNLGIGTTTATARLSSISSTAGILGALIQNTDNNPGASVLSVSNPNRGDNSDYSLLDISNFAGSKFLVRGDGNVGVGITSPLAKLQVNQVDTSIGVLFNGTTKGVRFGFNSSNSIIEGVDSTGTGSYQPLYVNGSTLQLGTGGVERIRIDANGSVGIGTSTPGSLLTVASSTAAGTSKLFSVASSSPLFDILANGNVGIGTNAPTARLRVTGGDIVIDSNSYLYASGVGTLRLGDDDDISFSGGKMFLQNSTGNIGIGTTTPGSKLSVQGDAYIGGNVTATGTLNVTGKTTLTTASSTGLTATSLYSTLFNSTGTSTFATTGGSVGIGTTAPGAKLTVQQDQDAISYLDYYNTTVGASAAVYLRQITQNAAGSGTIASGLLKYTAGELRLINGETSATGATTFYTAGSERARITSAGNFGIGTTTPNSLLSIASSTAAGTSALLTVGTSSSIFSILANGNIGINNGSPASLLHVGGGAATLSITPTAQISAVAGSSTLAISAPSGSTNSAQLWLENLGQRNWTLEASRGQDAFNIAINNDVNKLFTILATGNVGIGTTNPTSKLSILDSGNTAAGQQIRLGNVAAVSDYTIGRNITTGFLDFSGSQTGFVGYTFSGGNVGIGTTTPSAQLHLVSATNASGGLLIESTSGSAGGIADIELRGRRDDSNGSVPFGGSLYLSRLYTPGNMVQGANDTFSQLGNILFGGNAGGTSTSNIVYPASIGGIVEGTFTSSSAANTGLVFRTGVVGQAKDTANAQFGTERLRITSSGNVGIGTTTPQARLTVQGTSTGRVSIGTWTDPTYGAISLNGNWGGTADYNFLSGIADTNLYINRPSGKDIYFAEQGISGQFTLKSGGNVGVGTTTPGSKLTVAGDALISGANPVITLASAANFWTMQAVNGAQFRISEAGSSERFTIAAGGNVGIGASSPGSKLTVGATLTDTSGFIFGTNTGITVNPSGASTASFYGALTQITSTGSNISSSNNIYGSFTDAVHGTSATIGNMSGLYNRIQNSSTGTITNGRGLEVTILNNATGTISNAAGVYVNTPGNTSGTLTNTYGLYINSQTVGTQTNTPFGVYQAGASDKNYFAGNVGIGTSTPSAKLTVSPYQSNIGTLTNNATSLIVGNSTALGTTAGSYLYSQELQSNAANVVRLQTATYRRVAGADWNGTAYRLQYGVDNSFTDGSKAYIEVGAGDPSVTGGGFLSFGTAGSDRLVVNNTGNVGIGTTTPGTRLTVVGTSTFAGTTAAPGVLAFLNTTTGFNTFLKASTTQATNLAFTLPGNLGTAGQALLSDGNGGLYWGSSSGTSLTSALTLNVTSTSTNFLTKNLTADYSITGATVSTGVSTSSDRIALSLASTTVIGNGTMTAGPSLNTGTADGGAHSILRPDGKYLLINGSTTATTNIYDPVTNTFSAGPTLASGVAYNGGFSIQRPDGKFLVVNGNHVANTNIYDPVANTFAAGPAIASSLINYGSHAIQRPDGKFLIINANTNAVTNIYDPIANSMSAGPSLATSTAYAGSHSIQRPDGKFLVVNGNTTNATNIYDPVANTFVAGPVLASGTVFTGGFSLQRPDGKFLIFDGNGSTATNLYDPIANTMTTGPTVTSGINHGAHALQRPDGKFLVITGGTTNATAIYDPVTNTFSTGPTLATGTAHQGSHSIQRPDGKFLIINGGALATTNIYDPSYVTSGYYESEDISIPELNADSVLNYMTNGEGKIEIAVKTATSTAALAASYTTYATTTSGSRILPVTGALYAKVRVTMTRTVPTLRQPLTVNNKETATWLGESDTKYQRVFPMPVVYNFNIDNHKGYTVTGNDFALASATSSLTVSTSSSPTISGLSTDGGLTLPYTTGIPANASIGDERGSMTPGPALGASIYSGASSIQRPDGKILIIHGQNQNITTLYDPYTNATSTGPTLTGNVYYGSHSFQRPDGKFVVFLGNAAATTNIYDPVANTFTAGPSLATGSIYNGAHTIQRPDGKFLTINGNTTTATNIYDPTVNAFSVGPVLTATAADGALSIKRPDGKFFVVLGGSTATTNIYDPMTNTFIAGPSLTSASTGAGAFALQRPDGKFLIMEGGASATTDIYDPFANTITAGPTNITYSVGSSAIQRPDGKFTLIPGAAGANARIYDPIANSISITGPSFVSGSPSNGGQSIPLPNGKYLILAGNTTVLTNIYDPGWVTRGTYDSELINDTTLDANSVLVWKGNADVYKSGVVSVRVRTATSSTAIASSTWRTLPTSGSRIGPGTGEVWMQVHIEMNRPVTSVTQPGALKNVFVSESGNVLYNRIPLNPSAGYTNQAQTFVLPTIYSYAIQKQDGQDLATFQFNGKNLFRFSASGDAYTSAGGTWNAGGADVAEFFPTGDESLEPGDVVSVSKDSAGLVAMTTESYDDTLLGIVTTAPGLRLGSDDIGENQNKQPIALSGRVPVKISLENGVIHKGDYLTSSSRPGYAMKALDAGRVVGIALEDYMLEQDTANNGAGKVLAFVNPHFYMGTTLSAKVSSTFSRFAVMIQKGVAELGVTILDNGNVGIGVANPLSRFHVSGEIRTGVASSTAGRLIFQNDANGYTTTLRSATGTMNSDLLFTLPSTSGKSGQALLTDGAGVLYFGDAALVASGTQPVAGLTSRWISDHELGSGVLMDDGIVAGINATSSMYTFNIQGKAAQNPLNVASSSGGSLFSVSALGNVSVGTASSSATSTVSSRFDIFQTAADTSLDFLRLLSQIDTNTHTPAQNVLFRVDNTGNLFTEGSLNANALASISEVYPSNEVLDAGTVVAFGTSSPSSATSTATTSATVTWNATGDNSDDYQMAFIRKADTAGDAIGVVSTKSAINLAANTKGGVPVVFGGRVPVKVTTENGEVHAGDYLTVSKNVPGYAMKLTGEGRSIGRALSDYVVGRDKVLMLVEVGNQKLDFAGKTATTTGMLTTGNIDLNANGVAITNIKSLASANGTWSIDENGRIVAKVLCLEDVCIDKTMLTNILNSTGQHSAQVSIPQTDSTSTATTSQEGDTTGSSTVPLSPPVDTVLGQDSAPTTESSGGNTVSSNDPASDPTTQTPEPAPVSQAPADGGEPTS